MSLWRISPLRNYECHESHKAWAEPLAAAGMVRVLVWFMVRIFG